MERQVKITGGNNGGKFLFEVKYAYKEPGLHTKLFAKVPFAMGTQTTSDRLSSSVYKQPMDACEINTYRLLESSFSAPMPKFYFGDISNETSNFILITERIPFVDVGAQRFKRPILNAMEIEGPYDKCKDYQLRSPAKEYYILIMQLSGRIAGCHKAGKFGPDAMLRQNFIWADSSSNFGSASVWGGAQKGGEEQLRSTFDMGYNFISNTAKQLYPDYVQTQEFQNKYMQTMLTLSKYTTAIETWKHADSNYVAMGHQNLNIDNVYFWRDETGGLCAGIFDFGAFGCSCLPHKMWWALNMSDFDNIKDHLDDYIDAFITSYVDSGGAVLDRLVVRKMMILTALQNMVIMINAIPNNFKMCPRQEWATIKDRHDPRIANDIDNKSTLRSCVHVLGVCVRVIEELDGPEVLQEFVEAELQREEQCILQREREEQRDREAAEIARIARQEKQAREAAEAEQIAKERRAWDEAEARQEAEERRRALVAEEEAKLKAREAQEISAEASAQLRARETAEHNKHDRQGEHAVGSGGRPEHRKTGHVPADRTRDETTQKALLGQEARRLKIAKPWGGYTGRKRRMFCLHGTACSEPIFRLQLQKLLPKLEDKVDLTFLDGPREITQGPAFEVMQKFFPGHPNRMWSQTRLDHRGWRAYDDAAETISWLQSQLQALDFNALQGMGQVDGVLGFSAGADHAVMLAAKEYLRGRPFGFLILLSPSAPGYTDQLPKLFSEKIGCPALLARGKREGYGAGLEPIFEATLSAGRFQLDEGGEKVPSNHVAKLFYDCEVLTHDEGHIPVPRNTTQAESITNRIVSFIFENS
eukprot:TRINITY_DN25329_c0_g1_i1.p1 TRINITY_DN25329_c0_g1~~TRINITY_DN25329_c0_g1_i1.p1  ORF type:complete len:956 (+),score=169.73 TRINITY_DN25329_c0_g1_i1:422-2869(+)